ncbi:MAG: hypothetical protein ABII90_07565 [Bacteroidota bacterium]
MEISTFVLQERENQPPKNKVVIQPALLNNRGVKDLPLACRNAVQAWLIVTSRAKCLPCGIRSSEAIPQGFWIGRC